LKNLIYPLLKTYKKGGVMNGKNLKNVLDEGGYIDYRNIFKDLEKVDEEVFEIENINWDEPESELPNWIKNKWKKYDMKNWNKE